MMSLSPVYMGVMYTNVHTYLVPYGRHYKPWLVYFYPSFEDNFFVFKEFFFGKLCSFVICTYGSREVFNQAWFMMVRVRYIVSSTLARNFTPIFPSIILLQTSV